MKFHNLNCVIVYSVTMSVHGYNCESFLFATLFTCCVQDNCHTNTLAPQSPCHNVNTIQILTNKAFDFIPPPLSLSLPFSYYLLLGFPVQWSTRADFSNVVGERELMDWRSFHGTMGTQCQITGLTQGRRYFIRAASGNVKGWGPYKCSVPASVIPSSE